MKQALRAWYSQIESYSMNKGFEKSKSEPTLYVIILIIALYVDELFYTRNNEKMIVEFKRNMMRRYKINDIGLLHHFLGMEIDQQPDGAFIYQKKYSNNVLMKFAMSD